MTTDPLEYLSDDLIATLERYEAWAFGSPLSQTSRSVLAKVPSRYREPGFWSGSFPGCTRHNDYIEKWAEYRVIAAHKRTNDMSSAVDEESLNCGDQLIEDLKYLNTQTAEAEFWNSYRKKSKRPADRVWGTVVIISASIVGIALTVGLLWLVPVIVVVAIAVGFFRRQ